MASSGQAVRVKAGSYNESFAMASGVHVVSDNSGGGDAQADYVNSDYYAWYGYYPKALTRANNVQLTGTITFGTLAEDVTVDGISVDYLPGPYTLDISGGSPVIKNSIIRRSSGTGRSCIKMSCSDEYTEPVIENNLLHSAGMRGIGVCVSNYTSPLIQDNEIWDTGGRGIDIIPKGTPGGEVTILNNLIFNNDGAGVGSTKIASNATYQLKIVIQGNTIHDNGLNPAAEDRTGIYLKRSRPSGPSLEITIGGSDPSRGNTIYNNGLAGTRLDGNNLGLNPVLIQNNTIYNNGKTGILLIDVGLSGSIASITDNTIYGQTASGINIGGTTYADIAYNSIYENHYGINFNMGSLEVDPDPPSSGTVNIEDNNIYSNSRAGIHVSDAITGGVTIAGNDIHDNVRGGIGIMNSCNLVINRNEIHENQRAGIHTGGTYEVEDDYFADSNIECTAAAEPYPCCTGAGTGTCNSTVGFIGNTDSAILDVSQNKVYGNGTSGYGAGMNIRHASGTIYNNLVYENERCGIKYGNYIAEIINNTVVDNGKVMFKGSGIAYDSLDGYVTDGCSGDGPSIPIRNNISALNNMTGIRTGSTVCLSGDYRDYNLLFGNQRTSDESPPFSQSYCFMQLCGCWQNDNEIFGDPQFMMVNFYCTEENVPYDCCTDAGTGTCNDYQLDTGSPGIGTGEGGIDMGAYGGPYAIDW
jgi:parallel beta-helix repeat protein